MQITFFFNAEPNVNNTKTACFNSNGLVRSMNLKPWFLQHTAKNKAQSSLSHLIFLFPKKKR